MATKVDHKNYPTLSTYSLLAGTGGFTGSGTINVYNGSYGTSNSGPIPVTIHGTSGTDNTSALTNLNTLVTDILAIKTSNPTLVAPFPSGNVIDLYPSTGANAIIYDSDSSNIVIGDNISTPTTVNFNGTSTDQFFIICENNGTYITPTITIKSNVTFNLQGGAQPCNIFWLCRNNSSSVNSTAQIDLRSANSNVYGNFILNADLISIFNTNNILVGSSPILGSLFSSTGNIQFSGDTNINLSNNPILASNYPNLVKYSLLAGPGGILNFATSQTTINITGTYGTSGSIDPNLTFSGGTPDPSNAPAALTSLTDMITDIIGLKDIYIQNTFDPLSSQIDLYPCNYINTTFAPSSFGGIYNFPSQLLIGDGTNPVTIVFHAYNPNDQFFIVCDSSIIIKNHVQFKLISDTPASGEIPAQNQNIFWIVNSNLQIFTIENNTDGNSTVGNIISLKEVIICNNIDGTVYASSYITFNTKGSIFSQFTINGSPLCFMKGSLILTNKGYVPVEELQVGDLVLSNGIIDQEKTVDQDNYVLKFEPVVFVGKIDNLPLSHKNAPVCIKANTFGEGLPFEDLRVSPGHRLLIDGNMICANELVNGTTIYQDFSCKKIEYWHIEFENHITVIANGILSESFISSEEYYNRFTQKSFLPREKEKEKEKENEIKLIINEIPVV